MSNDDDKIAEFTAQVALASILTAAGQIEEAGKAKIQAVFIYLTSQDGDLRERMQIAIDEDLPAVLAEILRGASWKPPFCEWDEALGVGQQLDNVVFLN